jgi:hypothetical protein
MSHGHHISPHAERPADVHVSLFYHHTRYIVAAHSTSAFTLHYATLHYINPAILLGPQLAS